MAKILFTWTFAAPFPHTYPPPSQTLQISNTIPTCSSPLGILQCTDPASRRLAAIQNHLGVSPILLRSLAYCDLCPNLLSIPLLVGKSTFFHWLLIASTLRSSGSRHPLLMGLRRLANRKRHHQWRSSLIFRELQRWQLCSLSFRRDLTQTSRSGHCVFATYAYIRHMMPHLDLVDGLLHSYGTRSSRIVFYWYLLMKHSWYDVKQHAWNVLSTT